ncbi:Do family serine endopeptidase [Microbaculum marinisediminis]|uniref:Probable periplasmic serine endoprotease DegP-like n=1 Tax=Microbaculum marinisediminis TaxID=2931392 RepID=A0AAW5QT25_9HYPH|nr:Do family serine endopeptidase [Microbaculum sp. A6E488]MCT8971186.1 Do family serine endopeptidase [Microbaculum sp. A6E488]
MPQFNSDRAPRRIRSALMAGTAALAIVGTAAGTGLLNPEHAAAENVSAKVQPIQTYDFADLVEAVSPAVVSVEVEGRDAKMAMTDAPGMPDFKDLPEDHPFRRFFKDFEDQFGRGGPGSGPDARKGQPKGPKRMGQGSGFIISDDGYVVTNNHVAGEAEKITVTTKDGTEYEAKLIGTDPKTDLALLKIEADTDLPYVEFADAEARVGQWVVAVGNPFGLGGTVTAGIVSANGRDIGSGPYDDYIQIDAPVNRGNSGGPTFSVDGKVIGVNTAIFSPSGGNVGIAFAIPAEIAVPVIEELKATGAVSRGWLGVQIQPVSQDIADSLGLDKPEGAIIASILDTGPAGDSDIRSGDVILSVNGKPVEDARDLARKIGDLDPDDEAELVIWRDGDTVDLSVKLGAQPVEKQRVASLAPEQSSSGEVENDKLGLVFAPADEGGVRVTEVDPDGEAARKGLQAGDVIVEAGGADIKDPADLTKAVEKAEEKGRKAVLLRVKSGDSERFVALSLRKA